MNNKHERFSPRKKAGKISVNKEAECNDCIHQQSPLPSFEDIGGIIQNQQTLEECPGDVGSTRYQALPSNYSQPSGKIAQELSAPLGGQDSDPIEGSTRKRDPVVVLAYDVFEDLLRGRLL